MQHIWERNPEDNIETVKLTLEVSFNLNGNTSAFEIGDRIENALDELDSDLISWRLELHENKTDDEKTKPHRRRKS